MKLSQHGVFARCLRVRENVRILAVSMLSLGASAVAFAQAGEPSAPPAPPPAPAPKIGPLYRPMPAAAPELVQIVFFRLAQRTAASGAANVYVDGRLEGTLMPDGYTRFCVKPGTYSVEAYVGDQPTYAGKADPKTEMDLQGGHTYFVGVSENGTGEPVPYRRAEAEHLLQTSREQINIINRASAVVPCGNEPAPEQTAQPEQPAVQSLLKFQVDAGALFGAGQGNSASMAPAGRAELKRIADEIRALPNGSVTRVVVQGHSDAVGSRENTLRLSRTRARTVGEALAEDGIPAGLIAAEGLGSAQLAVRCEPTGDMAKRIRCNAPNRRVEIDVEGHASGSGAAR